jgi:hypothetical protein
MNMKRYWVRRIASVLMLAALVAACAPVPAPAGVTARPAIATSAPPDQLVTQAARIVGVWQTFSPDCTPAFMLIRPDGTATWSCKQDGSNGISGTYHFDNGQFKVLNDFCGAEGQYQVYAAADGSTNKALLFKVVKDDCAAEVETLTRQEVTWVSALP